MKSILTLSMVLGYKYVTCSENQSAEN
uniref:Uncharacterized protein n=1 Tax=Ciona intestinalis TaxID=7719 RepID=H2Y0V3_CIOIN